MPITQGLVVGQFAGAALGDGTHWPAASGSTDLRTGGYRPLLQENQIDPPRDASLSNAWVAT